MDCKEFRNNHALFLDEQGSELDAFEMRSHMRYCAACARLDAVLRRGQLVMRNLPSISPSADFRARLEARLLADQAAAMAPVSAARAVRYAAIAAILVGVTLVSSRLMQSGPAADVRLPPVVASIPAQNPATFGTTALVATLPTGMSIWPAIVMASQVPVHLVTAENVGSH